jgi:nitrogen fixation/metabolism regulation signal transduction histidine kinase
MKQNVFFLSRWWNGRNLRTRLFLVFTTLFVFCAIFLSIFLLNSILMIDLNNQTRAIFDRNHQLYQLKILTREYELAINQFEINASTAAEEQLVSTGEKIDKNTASFRLLLPERDFASLEKFRNAKNQLSPKVDEIIQAMHAQDQMSVDMADNATPPLFQDMYDGIDIIYARSANELENISTTMTNLSVVDGVVSILIILAALLLALVAALIMYNQIDQPLDQLTSASQDLLEGKFQPADLEHLVRRSDEIGLITREFLTMAAALENHATQLQQGADEIRAKIH